MVSSDESRAQRSSWSPMTGSLAAVSDDSGPAASQRVTSPSSASSVGEVGSTLALARNRDTPASSAYRAAPSARSSRPGANRTSPANCDVSFARRSPSPSSAERLLTSSLTSAILKPRYVPIVAFKCSNHSPALREPRRGSTASARTARQSERIPSGSALRCSREPSSTRRARPTLDCRGSIASAPSSPWHVTHSLPRPAPGCRTSSESPAMQRISLGVGSRAGPPPRGRRRAVGQAGPRGELPAGLRPATLRS